MSDPLRPRRREDGTPASGRPSTAVRGAGSSSCRPTPSTGSARTPSTPSACSAARRQGPRPPDATAGPRLRRPRSTGSPPTCPAGRRGLVDALLAGRAHRHRAAPALAAPGTSARPAAPSRSGCRTTSPPSRCSAHRPARRLQRQPLTGTPAATDADEARTCSAAPSRSTSTAGPSPGSAARRSSTHRGAAAAGARGGDQPRRAELVAVLEVVPVARARTMRTMDGLQWTRREPEPTSTGGGGPGVRVYLLVFLAAGVVTYLRRRARAGSAGAVARVRDRDVHASRHRGWAAWRCSPAWSRFLSPSLPFLASQPRSSTTPGACCSAGAMSARSAWPTTIWDLDWLTKLGARCSPPASWSQGRPALHPASAGVDQPLTRAGVLFTVLSSSSR